MNFVGCWNVDFKYDSVIAMNSVCSEIYFNGVSSYNELAFVRLYSEIWKWI